MPPASLQFGPFAFEPEGPRLLKAGQPVPLEPKALETLRVFLERPGEVLDKATLMALIWPGVAVEETGLARNISLLRKALEDDAAAPRFIETVPRKGYRFVAEVRWTESDGLERPAPGKPPSRRRSRLALLSALFAGALGLLYWQCYRPSPHAPPRSGRARVAALTFTAEAGLEPLNTGFLELLDAELAGQDRFQALSPDTVRRYQRLHIPPHVMGRILGLDFVLEGRLHRVGNQICLTPRLVDVHSGALVWSAVHGYAEVDFPRQRPEAARRIVQEAARCVR